MPNVGYAFISAYIKSAESRTVGVDILDGLSQQPEPQDVLNALKGTHVGSYLEEVTQDTFRDVDMNLWRYFSACIAELGWFKLMPSDMRRILAAYSERYTVFNIKAALRSLGVGGGADMIPVGTLSDRGLLGRLAEAGDTDVLADVLADADLPEYASIVRGYKEGEDMALTAEAALDRAYYRSLLSLPVKDGELSKALRLMVDMANLKLIVRALAADRAQAAVGLVIEGGYVISEVVAGQLLTQRIADMASVVGGGPYLDMVRDVAAAYERDGAAVAEEVIEQYRFAMLKDMLAIRLMSPVMILWHLIAKETEVRNLRLLFKAAFDGLPIARIRGYMLFS